MATKYWTIDESSYRIDKNVFPTPEEAIQKASECARILGRDISVYEYEDSQRSEYGQVAPNGDFKLGNSPTKNPPTGDPGGADALELGLQLHPAVLGYVQVLDEVSEALEAKGALEVAAMVDDAALEIITMASRSNTSDSVKKHKK